jgi:hypothetical protein
MQTSAKEIDMTKYLVLYHAPATAREMMAKAPPEQAKAGMELWMKWSKRVGPAMVDMGAPLGRSVALRGKPANLDAGVAGYGIVQAESLEAAQNLMDDHPHFHTPGGWIEILEFVKLPGM